jgi:hypothetical protein
MRNVWILMAADATIGLGKVLAALMIAIGSIRGALSGIDLMGLLASPADITRWAESVVLALSKAFMGGRVWDAAIGSAYNRSLSLIAELDRKAGAATPASGSATSEMQRQEASMAAERIRTAINEPTWASEGVIPRSLQEQNELLKALIQVVGAKKGVSVIVGGERIAGGQMAYE